MTNDNPDPRNWMVMCGQPIDTTKGGGYEFFGPFTEKEALKARENMLENMLKYNVSGSFIVMAVQLLRYNVKE